MKKYLYSVWFRDSSFDPDDEDYEWVACIIIDAETSEKAQEWGDVLAKQYCSRDSNQMFLNSNVEEADFKTKSQGNLSRVPKITYGQNASDKEIGW